MGESSRSLTSMWFLFPLALPAIVAGQCQVNLDKVSGKFPPLLLQKSQFIFPTEKVEDERVLKFKEGDSLELFCHGGSDAKQAGIYVKRSDKTKKDSKVSLACASGEFLVSGSDEKIAVEKATCNQKQEPRLDRTQEQCSPVGSDGRTDKLESLQKVSIGWQIEGTFIEQIGLCVDESNFGTIWTNHTVRGASINLRDIDPKRPSFRADTSAYTRKNQRIESFVPAPKYYWKVVQDPETKTAAAFIGLNDPHTNVAPPELCKNRCSEMSSWVDWGIDKLDSGYMYCCSVEDAAKAIKAIPDMTAPSGLIGGSGTPSTGGGEDFSAAGTCQAGPCQCSCAKNDQGVYTCTCTCNN